MSSFLLRGTLRTIKSGKRIAALYDIHANLPALEAVLEDVRGSECDGIVVGGDVFPGPMPRETLAYLLAVELPCQFIRGNGDREVLAQLRGEPVKVPECYQESMRWVSSQLSPDCEDMIASWPATFELAVDSLGTVLFCHATLRNDFEIFTHSTPEEHVLPALQGTSAKVIVCGHTHMQFRRQVGPITVVNAGSVGMPFGEPGAYWLALGPEIQLRKTGFDLSSAAERVRQTAYPLRDQFARDSILHPPSEATMIEVFGNSGL